jgi:peptidoglycan/LPS O-acetylase OafA/YrhL
MPVIKNSSNYIDSLDVLRAIAALLVCFQHMCLSWGAQETLSSFKSTLAHQVIWDLDLGKIGVMIFFLISGYLIPFTVTSSGMAAQRLFIKKRLLRIYPMFLFAIMVSLFVKAWEDNYEFDIVLLILNLLLVPNFFERAFISGVFWTLQIEVFFYLIVATFVPWTTFSGKGNLISLVLVVLALGAEAARALALDSSVVREVARVLGMTAFIFLGALIRLWREQLLDKGGAATLCLFMVYEFLYRGYKFAQLEAVSVAPKFSSLAGAIAISVFLLVLYVKKGPQFIAFFGKISYSLYLVHLPVITLTISALTWIAPYLTSMLLDSVFFFLSLGISIAISALTYRYIELRFLIR